MVPVITFAQINDVLRGSVDMHVHFGPDPIVPRRVDATSAAIDAQQAGLGAIVLKSHSYPTAPLAHMAQLAAPNVRVIGSVCLDEDVGGLNVHAIQTSAQLGAKVVWLPTFTAKNSMLKVARRQGRHVEGEGIWLLDEDGHLVPDAIKVIAAVKKYDMVLATGHVSPTEIFAVVEECNRIGLDKIVITHALEQSACEEVLTVDQTVALAKRGAFIEHCMLSCCPVHNANKFMLNPDVIVEAIRATGPEKCVLGTDLGVAWNPPPAEGMRMFVSMLLRHGIREEDVRQMATTNSRWLLGLDDQSQDN
jgi:hypothetical protein